MSPKRLHVTITSNCEGSRTICIKRLSIYWWLASISGNSSRTCLNTRCQRSCPKVSAFDLSLMHTRFSLRAFAYSKAYRMMRSTPLRVFRSSCTAISSAVPFLKFPPIPT